MRQLWAPLVALRLLRLAPQLRARLGAKDLLLARALQPLARGPEHDDALLPASFLLRALLVLRLGGQAACRTRPGAMLGFAALSRRLSPGRPTDFVWERLIQWA